MERIPNHRRLTLEHDMPRLSELQKVVHGHTQGLLKHADGLAEESLIEDERSNRSGSNVVEEKLRLLLQNSTTRFSFFRSCLPPLSQ